MANNEKISAVIQGYEDQILQLRVEIEHLADALDHSVPVDEVKSIVCDLMDENKALRDALDESTKHLDNYETGVQEVQNLIRGIKDEDFACLARDVNRLRDQNWRLSVYKTQCEEYKARIAVLEAGKKEWFQMTYLSLICGLGIWSKFNFVLFLLSPLLLLYMILILASYGFFFLIEKLKNKVTVYFVHRGLKMICYDRYSSALVDWIFI